MSSTLGQNIVKEIVKISNDKLEIIKKKKEKYYNIIEKLTPFEAIFKAALEIYTPQIWEDPKVKVYCKCCKHFSKGDGTIWAEICNVAKPIISDTYYEPKGEITHIHPCEKNGWNDCKDFKKK